jgi:hypothetical protein
MKTNLVTYIHTTYHVLVECANKHDYDGLYMGTSSVV